MPLIEDTLFGLKRRDLRHRCNAGEVDPLSVGLARYHPPTSIENDRMDARGGTQVDGQRGMVDKPSCDNGRRVGIVVEQSSL